MFPEHTVCILDCFSTQCEYHASFPNIHEYRQYKYIKYAAKNICSMCHSWHIFLLVAANDYPSFSIYFCHGLAVHNGRHVITSAYTAKSAYRVLWTVMLSFTSLLSYHSSWFPCEVHELILSNLWHNHKINYLLYDDISSAMILTSTGRLLVLYVLKT
jgi:hypothetical protein